MGETLPTEPQAARPAGSGKVAAIVGIVLGFIAYIVPGIFSLRSYRRWKRGEIRRPMFAWTTAAIVGPLLVLSARLLPPLHPAARRGRLLGSNERLAHLEAAELRGSKCPELLSLELSSL